MEATVKIKELNKGIKIEEDILNTLRIKMTAIGVEN